MTAEADAAAAAAAIPASAAAAAEAPVVDAAAAFVAPAAMADDAAAAAAAATNAAAAVVVVVVAAAAAAGVAAVAAIVMDATAAAAVAAAAAVLLQPLQPLQLSKARMKWMPPTRPPWLLPKQPVATLGPAMASGKLKQNLMKKNQCQMKNMISCPATIKTGLSTKPRKHGPQGQRPHLKWRISTIRFCSAWPNSWQIADYSRHLAINQQQTDLHFGSCTAMNIRAKDRRMDPYLQVPNGLWLQLLGKVHSVRRDKLYSAWIPLNTRCYQSRKGKIKETHIKANHSYPWGGDRCFQPICDKIVQQFGYHWLTSEPFSGAFREAENSSRNRKYLLVAMCLSPLGSWTSSVKSCCWNFVWSDKMIHWMNIV
jgi:hypothetical protein